MGGNIMGLKKAVDIFSIILSKLLMIAVAVMVVYWTVSTDMLGGLAWYYQPGSYIMENTHILLMVLGMVVLFGEAAVVYRVFRDFDRFKVKILHAILLSLGVACIVMGIYLIFNHHNKTVGERNLYSTHSWIGIVTIIVFGLQFLLGFLIFLFPGGSPKIRAVYLKLHQFFGPTLLVGVFGSCISGINEKLQNEPGYGTLQPPYIQLGNYLGVVIMGYITSVLWIIFSVEKQKPISNKPVMNGNDNKAADVTSL